MNKIYWEIWIQDGEFKEMLAKVKSKGLANIVYNQIVETYKKTNYMIILK